MVSIHELRQFCEVNAAAENWAALIAQLGLSADAAAISDVRGEAAKYVKISHSAVRVCRDIHGHGCACCEKDTPRPKQPDAMSQSTVITM